MCERVFLAVILFVLCIIIRRVAQEDENGIGEKLVFQLDGAPPHYYARVREYLDHRFPVRWIGRRGPIES